MVFSQRSGFELRKNRLTLLLEAARSEGRPLIDLTESNPTRVGLVYPEKALLEALADARSLLYAPHSMGLPEARQAVADYYGRRGASLDADQIVLTTGTSEAYAYLFKLLMDPGDRLLVPQPSYPLLDFLTVLESVQIAPYPLLYQEGWRWQKELLEPCLTAASRALLVLHPNNPTGTYLKPEEWRTLQELCARSNLSLICDEVFYDYPLDPTGPRLNPVGKTPALTFLLNGLSKSAGLPQLKLSWLVVEGPPELRRSALERLEVLADTFLSVATPVQLALPRLLPLTAPIQQQIRKRICENFRWLADRLHDSALDLLPAEGGWSATLRLPHTRSEEAWTLRLLKNHGVLVHPGYFFGFPQEPLLVVSLLVAPDLFQEGIGRLLQALD